MPWSWDDELDDDSSIAPGAGRGGESLMGQEPTTVDPLSETSPSERMLDHFEVGAVSSDSKPRSLNHPLTLSIAAFVSRSASSSSVRS